MQLFNKIFRKNKASIGITAISFTSEGIALAISQYTINQKLKLIHCEFIHTNNKQLSLQQITETHHLKGYDCHLVLAPNDYRLITIEPPAVTEKEMPEAIRWKISDLVEFHIDDAIIDHYPLPISERVNTEKKWRLLPRLNLQSNL